MHQQTPPPPNAKHAPLWSSASQPTKAQHVHRIIVILWQSGAKILPQWSVRRDKHAPATPPDEMRQECKTRPLLRTCEPLAIAVPVALDRPADIFAPCAPTDARHRSRARRLQCNTRREVRETLLGAPTGQASPPSSANAAKRHSQAQRWRAACALCRLRSAGASARVRSFFSS